MFRKKHSEESKLKIGLASKRMWQNESIRKRLSEIKIGHKYSLGRTHTIETKLKISAKNKGKFIGSKSGRYRKWDELTYGGKHIRIKQLWGNAHLCENERCLGESKRFEWANISGQYKEEKSDWKMLCHKCHMKHDKQKFKWKITGEVSVIQKDKIGNVIKVHKSISSASRETGISQSSISNIFLNISKSAGGFLWCRA